MRVRGGDAGGDGGGGRVLSLLWEGKERGLVCRMEERGIGMVKGRKGW